MRVITRLNVGGPSYQAVYLTQRLQGPEFESALLVGNVGPAEGSAERLAEERGVSLTRIPGLGREISPAVDGRTLLHLYTAMRRFRPDVVHTHMAKAGVVGRLAARLARVPAVVHTYHGHVFHGYFSRHKTAWFLAIERAMARFTDRLIVLGEAQEREILGFGVGGPEQMARIPLGLELEPFLAAERQRGMLRQELGISPETPLVGIVARLVPIKAHDLFLEAAHRVAKIRPEAQFLVIGDGELRADLEHRARAGGFEVLSEAPGARGLQIADCGLRIGEGGLLLQSAIRNPQSAIPTVRFLGFRADLARIYADLDVVVLCSRNEGLPVSMIEALAAARPVVATDVGAVRDLVLPGETGRLVRSGDAEGLAAGILAHLEERGRARAMGERGRQWVYPRFSIERLEEEIRRLYYGLVAKSAGVCSR